MGLFSIGDRTMDLPSQSRASAVVHIENCTARKMRIMVPSVIS